MKYTTKAIKGTNLIIVHYLNEGKRVEVKEEVFHTYSDGTKVLCSSSKIWLKEGDKPSETTFIFTREGLHLMELNYKLGGCPLSLKGFYRYSECCGSGIEWCGRPANIAKRLASAEASIPKELYGLMTHIGGNC